MDLLSYTPAIGFEFRLARAPRADAAAKPRERGAAAGEPRQQVLELREFDLPLAFARPRAPGENIENQLRPIDDLAIGALFDVPDLGGRQLAVDNHHVDRVARAFGCELVELASADERRRIRSGPLLNHSQHDNGTGRIGEASELIERTVRVHAAVIAEVRDRRAPRARGVGVTALFRRKF